MNKTILDNTFLDTLPFAAYVVDIETYEVVYLNQLMNDKLYAPQEEFCWKKIYGQEEVCSWCSIAALKSIELKAKNKKVQNSFFDESNDIWIQSYNELVRWVDGRVVKYCIEIDITEQKEIQSSMIETQTKLAIQSKELQKANEKLEFLATKDYLTKINNRGNFFKLADLIWNQKTADTEKLYVAMMDLDKFKNINDTYGHAAGDQVLIIFAKTVSDMLEDTDIFGRLGGEEFGVLLKSNNTESVVKKLEKIKNAIEQISIKNAQDEIRFTMSIGLSQKEGAEPIDVCLEKADIQLYDAKKSGRNTIRYKTR